jgi:hypothetical protein
MRASGSPAAAGYRRQTSVRAVSGRRAIPMTKSRITSGQVWQYQNGLAGLRGLGMPPPYPAIALHSGPVQFF